MQFHFHANQSHFHKNGFTLTLTLKQRHKGTRKWPILTRFDPDNKSAVLREKIRLVCHSLYTDYRRRAWKIWAKILKTHKAYRRESGLVKTITYMLREVSECVFRVLNNSSFQALLNPFWNRPNTGLGRFKYFIDAVLSWFLNKKQNRKRFYIKIRNRELSCTRALFLITGMFYSVAQALTKAPRQPASLKCNFLIGWKNDVI